MWCSCGSLTSKQVVADNLVIWINLTWGLIHKTIITAMYNLVISWGVLHEKWSINKSVPWINIFHPFPPISKETLHWQGKNITFRKLLYDWEFERVVDLFRTLDLLKVSKNLRIWCAGNLDVTESTLLDLHTITRLG